MILPVVRRELQGRARAPTTRLVRLGAAAVSIAIAIFTMLLMAGVSDPSQVGRVLFRILSWLGFVFCLIEGPRMASDSLSEEKRNGTLGLLFLTDLSSTDILLGKLVAVSLNSFYGLLATFPALALPLLVGGVSGPEFWRTVLTLVSTLWLSFAVSMCVSATSRAAVRSLGGALLTLGLIMVLSPLLHSVTNLISVQFSPYYALVGSSDVAYRAAPAAYWIPLSEVFALGLFLLVAAAICLRRSWHEQATSRLAPKRFSNLLRPPRWLLHANPTRWLSTRIIEGAVLCRLLAAVFSVVAVAILCFFPVVSELSAGALLGTACLHLFLCIWIGIVSSQLLWQERDSGALELLLCCPIQTNKIVDGFADGFRWVFEAPIACILIVEVFLFPYLFSVAVNTVPLGVTFLLLALAMATFISECYALGWFGLWMGLTTRKQVMAITKTFLWVSVLPLLLSGWCWPVWIGGGVVKNLVFIHFARDRLFSEIRRRASEPVIAGKSAPPDRGRLPEVLPVPSERDVH